MPSICHIYRIFIAYDLSRPCFRKHLYNLVNLIFIYCNIQCHNTQYNVEHCSMNYPFCSNLKHRKYDMFILSILSTITTIYNTIYIVNIILSDIYIYIYIYIYNNNKNTCVLFRMIQAK